jgi:hypothetical protein
LLVEQYYEPTQSLCPCDHAFIYVSSYFFSEPLSWQPPPLNNFFPQQEPRFIFETRLLPKLSIYKIIGTYKVEWSHYFTNLYFADIIKGFQTPLRKLDKGGDYVSICF